MRKTATAAAMAAALTIGGATGVALFAPEGVNAQTDPTTETVPDPSTDAKPGRGAFLAETLAPLVADGTIDQAQADAVIAAIDAARPERGPGGPGRGHGGPFGGGVVAEALGLTVEELRTAVADGQTIAEIAEANGVDIAEVKAALLAENDERLAEAVESGRLTEAEAAERRTEAESRIDDLINGELPIRGRGLDHAPGAPADSATDVAPADS